MAEHDNEDVFRSHSGAHSVTESSDVTPVPSSCSPLEDSLHSIVELPSSAGSCKCDHYSFMDCVSGNRASFISSICEIEHIAKFLLIGFETLMLTV